MRKILSLIMSLLMLFTTFMVGEKVFAISHEDDLQGFIDETKELLTFEPEQLIETNSETMMRTKTIRIFLLAD